MRQKVTLKDVFPGGRPSKYKNRKIIVDGQKFDSMKELARWQELKMLERAGEITDLFRQQEFILIPTQIDSKTGKVIERACTYVADFTYREKGKLVVEDTKSPATRTPAYIIKRKLMLSGYGIRIKEV